MRSWHRPGPGGNPLGRRRPSVWRSRWLVVVAVLVGALLGSGWAARQSGWPARQSGWPARQPAPYASLSWVGIAHLCPDGGLCNSLALADGFLRSSAVLQRAVRLSGSRVSADTLDQGLKVEVPDTGPTAMVVTRIRVRDATAKGAAQLANAVALAAQQVMAEHQDASARHRVALLAGEQRQLQDELDGLDRQLAADPENAALRAHRDAIARPLNALTDQLEADPYGDKYRVQVWQEQAAVAQEPVRPKPLGAAIGGLVGLIVGAGLAWWRRRPSSTRTTAAGEGR